MPALPADIQRASRDARIVRREDPVIRSLFPSARDQVNAPEPGFFRLATDAATALGQKAQLTAVFRRRFAVEIDGVLWVDPTESDASGDPLTYRLVDDELGVDGPCLITRARIDLENEVTQLEVLV